MCDITRMALSTVTAALTQFNASANWYGSRDTAALRLEAIEFLLANRAERIGDQGSTLEYSSLEKMREQLIGFLGAAAPRSFGRSRRNGVAYTQRGGIQ